MMDGERGDEIGRILSDGQIFDISPTLSPDLAVWPGDPHVETERIASLSEGDAFNLSRFSMSAHAGAHVDAPLHYLQNGIGADRLDLGALVGPATVFEIPGPGPIDEAILEGLDWPDRLERVIFKTCGPSSQAGACLPGRGSRRSPTRESEPSPQPLGYYEPFSGLDESGARWLVERQVRSIGIDSPSIARMDGLEATHRILLEAKVIPIEGLDLRAVEAGAYLLICLPLKLAGADGAPARAILIAAG